MTQKFIDRDGLKVLWKQTSLQDYPNNETLMAVIDAIDETKSDKNHTHTTGDIEGLEETINDISKAIIDVVELPNEDIREDCFYRLVSAKSLFEKVDRTQYGDMVICVNSLPETGEDVTDVEMSFFKWYCNVEDNGVYGYVNELLASAFGFPSSGWIDYGTLCTFIGETYSGIITHIDDAKEDGTFRILISHSLHIYKDGWKELPYAYESAPEFDIKFDGIIGDKFALDMSILGYDGVYAVKVSDKVPSYEQLLNTKLYCPAWSENYIYLFESIINTEMFQGSFVIGLNDFIFAAIVYDAETFSSSLGLPSDSGYLTNGIYFIKSDDVYVTHLVDASARIQKIDSKFIDINISYNDLSNKPTIYTDVVRYGTNQSLSDAAKSRARSNIDVYSKSEVDTKIANVNLNEYIKTTEVDERLTDYAKTTEVDEKLTDYAKTTEVDEKLESYSSHLPKEGLWTILYENDIYIAVCYSTITHLFQGCYYSNDGINWTLTLERQGSYNYFQDLCYGNGKFIIVCNNYGENGVFYSNDGINWNISNTSEYGKICYDGEKFVMINSDIVLCSTNAVDWVQTASLTLTGYVIKSICYGDGKYIVVGQGGNATTTNKALYSTNAIDWMEITLPMSATFFDVCYGNGKFVAVTVSNGAVYSIDGINWRKCESTIKGSRIAYANGCFVTKPISGNIIYNSIDGINWQQIEIPNEFYGLINSTQNGFIMSGKKDYNGSGTELGNNMMFSIDGVIWNEKKRLSQSNQDVTSEVAQLIQPHLSLTAEEIGLGNVDNTKDIDKPISTATQAALNQLKDELSESIVSKSENWTVIDNQGNVMATINANGLQIASIITESIILNGIDINDIIEAKVKAYINESILGGEW